MTDLATADLDHYIGVAKQYAGWGVPVQMQPDYLLRVLEQARQVATIRETTLEEARALVAVHLGHRNGDTCVMAIDNKLEALGVCNIEVLRL